MTPIPANDAVPLDGLRLLARLVADVWRAGGVPPAPDDRRSRALPVTVTLIPSDRGR